MKEATRNWPSRRCRSGEERGPLACEDIEKVRKLTPDGMKLNLRKLKGLSLISSNCNGFSFVTPLGARIYKI
jgi:hypothetical protein